MNQVQAKKSQQDGGYVLLGVVILLALSLLVSIGMLDSSATNAKTRSIVTTQSEYYYEVEETLNKVVGWLQINSKNIVNGFAAANFTNNFDLGSPTLGDNEGEHFSVPTMVKMKGTNDSVMLSNNSYFGTSAFPATTNIDTNAAFNALTEFQSADLGAANARIVLIWARETDGNYEPIFRIDVLTGNNPDRGVHSFSYVFSTLEASNGALQFYGRDFLTLNTPNNDCSSYQYTYDLPSASWNPGAPRSNCGVASDLAIGISSKVNGSAKSLINPGVSLNPPGGDISGSSCEGVGCHGYVLPVYGTFEDFCPVHNGDLAIVADTTLPNGGCWRNVAIENKKTLFLADTTTPYIFKFVDFKTNFAHLSFGPGGQIPPGSTVIVFAETINNDHMNGNQFYNALNAPHQVQFNYIGLNNLQFNGTAAFNALTTAPNASIDVNGNFNYYGGIWAKDLMVGGHAELFGDESVAGPPVLSDINFALKKTSQRFR
ncbi:hypothetical protein OAO01_00225 [Oligoflexia bacterium]|nr:hypothetical protein [Oligoflexia bacterium]